MSAAKGLTKKQLKAEKHKNRSKGASTAEKSNKRKRDDDEDSTQGAANVDLVNEEASKDKGKQKASKPSKAKRERPQRFIVFVGNLPYKVTADDITAHFAEPCGETPSVRLLSSKKGPETEGAKKLPSKGCAFLEFTSSTALQAALHLHQSLFKSSISTSKRKINVELTAGGGGNSEGRKNKLSEAKERLEKQREKNNEAFEEERRIKEEEKKKLREEWKKQLQEKQSEQEQKPQLKRQKNNKLPKFLTGANAAKLS